MRKGKSVHEDTKAREKDKLIKSLPA